MIKFNSDIITVEAAANDGTQTRTIMGIAVPYGVVSTVSDGTRVMFDQGSLPVEGKAPRLFMNHDSTAAIGKITARTEGVDGMYFEAKIAKTTMGNDALELALAGVLDSVSVGVNPTKFKFDSDGVMHIQAAEWVELSMVAVPAFSGAQITQVAASENETEIAGIHQNDQQVSNLETEAEQENEPMSEATPAPVEATVPTAPLPAQVKNKFEMPNPGEYMAAMHIGGDTFANVNRAYKEAMSARKTAFEFAAGDETTGDLPGLLPTPVLAPLVQNLNYMAPIFNAFGPRALPDGNGKSFIRPTIGQHTLAGQQSTQLTGVTARTMEITDNVVDRLTFAGQVTLSLQSIDFTSPSALNLILSDLAGQYMLAIDGYASSELEAASTNSYQWNDTTDPAQLLEGIYQSAYDASKDTYFYVDTMFMSTKAWFTVGKLVDDQNRPVFPAIAAPGLLGMNTLGAGSAASWSGQNPLGLQSIVGPQLADSTIIITNAARAFETYQALRGIMTVESPQTLGRIFSYYGYAAAFAAIPEMIRNIAVNY
jgi:HK97 family phage prohead protease